MQNLKCKLCGHHMTGGISRLKYHLAKLPRNDVSLCTGVNPEIMRSTHDSIHEKLRLQQTELSLQLLAWQEVQGYQCLPMSVGVVGGDPLIRLLRGGVLIPFCCTNRSWSTTF